MNQRLIALLLLALTACGDDAEPASGEPPAAVAASGAGETTQPAPSTTTATDPAPGPAASLGDCFPESLGGLAVMRMPSGMGGPFARAYLERVPSGRAININVWDASTDNIEGQLTQFPVIGQDGTRRNSNGGERVGGAFHERPSEAMWETLSTGGTRDTLTVRVSDARLVSLSVQPDATRGVATELFETLDLACITTAPI
jgi:hypothetical protein